MNIVDLLVILRKEWSKSYKYSCAPHSMLLPIDRLSSHVSSLQWYYVAWAKGYGAAPNLHNVACIHEPTDMKQHPTCIMVFMYVHRLIHEVTNSQTMAWCNNLFLLTLPPHLIANRLKISYSCDYSVKAVLVTDKTAKAELYTKVQQYIEVLLLDS